MCFIADVIESVRFVMVSFLGDNAYPILLLSMLALQTKVLGYRVGSYAYQSSENQSFAWDDDGN